MLIYYMFLEIRNLLIIGRTLSGKTTLSSVLCDTDGFKENGNTINETENLLKKDFECKGTKYYVIEIGVGNAREESKNILLNYLEDVCREKYYKLVKWDDLHSKINSTESNKNFAAKLEKADITISTGIKTNNRAQQWFNETYSKKENIDISESKNLKLKGFLEIKDFTKLKSIILKNFELNKLEISGCSQLDKIDLSELTKLTSLSLTDCQKLTGLDCSSTKLSSLKIINCPQLNKIIDRSKTKTKSLYARGYSNLSTLDCLETGFTILEINGCSQLNEVDLSKLPKITSLSVIDCSNLSNLDCSSTELTSLKISGCYRLEKFGCSKLPKLTSLSVIDCLKLTKLDCSNSEITDLEVSDLTELNCSNTSIKELSLNLCPYITKLDCSNNKNLKNLDISNCLKLESINCSNSKLTGLDISYCPELEEKKIPGVAITRKKENVKNILIVGRAGGVDTIGAGDTKLSLKDILYKIVDGIYAMPEGISQMLYVVDGRITGEEIKYLEGVDPVKKNKYFKLKTWDKLRENISEYVKNNEDALKRLENEPELEAFYNASKGCLIM
uniref:L domain-like protein n=1 Tax=Rhizophagus irregularis (strain DAOM 181602 / DAOM 197198 / MUCL 43194) TaxID=747089 RepID=U9SHJ5_RHIID